MQNLKICEEFRGEREGGVKKEQEEEGGVKKEQEGEGEELKRNKRRGAFLFQCIITVMGNYVRFWRTECS